MAKTTQGWRNFEYAAKAKIAASASRNTMTEEIEIKIRNRKEEPVKVIVKENLYRWTNWKIVANTQPYEKQDARTVHFPARVPPGGETIVRYTAQYSW